MVPWLRVLGTNGTSIFGATSGGKSPNAGDCGPAVARRPARRFIARDPATKKDDGARESQWSQGL
jgi:hypothetical protein